MPFTKYPGKFLQTDIRVKNDLMDVLLRLLSWVSLAGFLLSLGRIPLIGWQTSMVLPGIFVLLFWGLYLLRSHLSFLIKISIVLGCWGIQGIFGFLSYGLTYRGVGFFISLILLIGLFTGSRKGFLALAGVLAFMGGIAFAVWKGWWDFVPELQVFNGDMNHWLGVLTLTVLWSSAPLVVARRLQGLLETSLKQAGAQAKEMEALNHRLEKEMEKTRISENKFKTIMEQVPDIVSLIDEKGTLVYNSEASQRIHGWTASDMIGKDTFQFMHPDDRSGVLEAMAKVLQAAGNQVTAEYRYLNKDGSYIWMEATARNEFSNPALGALLTISRDISMRKKGEEEKEHLLRDYEVKNQELERFIYSVSHDLRAPIITVQGFLGYAKLALVTGNLDRASHDLDRIKKAVGKIEELLEDLLEVSSLGRVDHPPMEFQMGSALREALVSLEKQIQDLGVDFHQGENFPHLRGDLVRIVKIWQNLIENAVKFRSPDRPLVLKAGWQETSAGPEYYLEDNGLGIGEAYYEKIFGLFEKIDPRSEGTGLGLSMVKKIVEDHGGRIRVQSREGQGSTFFFTLGSGG